MRHFKPLLIPMALVLMWTSGIGQSVMKRPVSDSLTLAQAYMNLSLTATYFDSLDTGRISKILPFEAEELKSIVDEGFITKNSTLYNFTRSLLYFNFTKLQYRTRRKTGREVLVRWRGTLDRAIKHFNLAEIYEYYFVDAPRNSFYDLIRFDNDAVRSLKSNIQNLKNILTKRFNADIYPDFIEVYQKAKKTGEYDFEALLGYAKLYNFPLQLSILNNEPTVEKNNYYERSTSYVSNEYRLDRKLELIVEYLQLKYMTTEKYSAPSGRIDTQILYASYRNFMDRLKYENDVFIKKELTPQICKQLYAALRKKFPPTKNLGTVDQQATMAYMMSDFQEKEPYFFPNPAPLSSAFMSVSNFKPQWTRLGEVNDFLKTHLSAKGYEDQLRYWYDLDGFALGTRLEKFNKNGTPIAKERRFVKNLGGDGQFSYYEIFKSIFFEVASEFRMFVFVVASNRVTIDNEALSASRTDDLLRNSYTTLPDDLKNKTLSRKNFSVLVYHFHQNDIGQVPMLDLSGQWTVENHLKNAGLWGMIEE